MSIIRPYSIIIDDIHTTYNFNTSYAGEEVKDKTLLLKVLILLFLPLMLLTHPSSSPSSGVAAVAVVVACIVDERIYADGHYGLSNCSQA